MDFRNPARANTEISRTGIPKMIRKKKKKKLMMAFLDKLTAAFVALIIAYKPRLKIMISRNKERAWPAFERSGY